LNPLGDPVLVASLADRKSNPPHEIILGRTSRAQSMDALSSQGNAAGYKAVLVAAVAAEIFSMPTTPGSARENIGYGWYSGLRWRSPRRRLGAVNEAFDIPPETKNRRKVS